MSMNLAFLKPRAANLLITFVILFLPLIQERAPSELGGYSIVHYSPVFLLSAYLQMGEFQAILLMLGFALLIYLGLSVVLALISKFFTKKKK